MSGNLGARRRCKVCGRTRDGEPRNAENAAVCRRCYPRWVTWRNHRSLRVYLGHDLRKRIDRAAKKAGVSPQVYLRRLIARRFRVPKSVYPN